MGRLVIPALLFFLGCASTEEHHYAPEDGVLNTWNIGVAEEDFSRHPSTRSPFEAFWKTCELTGKEGFSSKTSYFCE